MALAIIGGGVAGLIANRGLAAAPGILLAGLIFVAFNALLASGTRSLIGRLMSRCKIREVVILVTHVHLDAAAGFHAV